MKSFLATILLVAVVSQSLANDRLIAAAGGSFAPSDGDSGTTASLLYFWSTEERSSIGVELERRTFESRIFGVDGVEVDSWLLSTKLRYAIVPEGDVRWYVGGSIGVSVNKIDAGAVERSRSALFVTDVGTGLDLAALAGVDYRLSATTRLFAEAAYDVNFQLTEEFRGAGSGSEQLGGLSLKAGIGYAF